MASVTFTIPGDVDTTVTVTEVINPSTGFRELEFSLTAEVSGDVEADIRSLYFHMADESVLGSLSITGDDVTGSAIQANGVNSVGNGKGNGGNVKGKGNKADGYDVGVNFGTPGMGQDSIETTSFTLASSLGDLNLDILSEMGFGLRIQTTDDDGSGQKLSADAPYINLPPDAYDDTGPNIVESGDSILIDVLANDADRDGALDPSTISSSGGALGSAAANSGQLEYTANDLTGDPADDSGVDTVSYTVDDTEGATSNAANVTVHVIDPLAETDVDSAAAAANGQLITLSMTTEDRTYNDESEIAVTINFGDLSQPDVNVSFVVDGSASINAFEWQQQIQAVQDTIDDIYAQFDGSGTNVEIQLVQFSGQYNVNDPAPEAYQETFDLFADYAGTLSDIVANPTVLSTQLNEYTNYEAGFDDALEFFSDASRAGEENYLVFISDGQATRAVRPGPNENLGIATGDPSYYLDEVNGLKAGGVSISAFGFGGVDVNRLNLIDNTGGAQRFNTATELGDALGASPIFPADVFEFAITVNGVDIGADIGDLVAIGGGDLAYTGDLTGLDNSHGAVNTVVATAGFDTDNDDVVDEWRTVTTEINGTDGSDIFVFA